MNRTRAKLIITTVLIVILLTVGIHIAGMHSKRMVSLREAGVEAVVVSHDKSVYPDFIYNSCAINNDSISGEKEHKIPLSHTADMEELAKLSTDIVTGRITGLCYTFINGTAYTVADLHISSSFKGSLVSDDIVSLYFLGGYASVQDYNSFYGIQDGDPNKFYKFTVKGYPVPALEQDMLFFMSSNSVQQDIPKNVYSLTSPANSVYTPSSDGESYTGNGKRFTGEFLKELVQQDFRI